MTGTFDEDGDFFCADMVVVKKQKIESSNKCVFFMVIYFLMRPS